MSVLNVKDGYVKKYKVGLLGGGKWKDRYLRLSSDSSLCWFDHSRDGFPAGRILLKDVVPYICVGEMTNTIPAARPSLPPGTSIDHLVAIGTDQQGLNVHWFLFANDYDLELWFKEIVKTLPKPAVPQSANSNGGYPEPPPPYTESYQPNQIHLPRGTGAGYQGPVPAPVHTPVVQHQIWASNNRNNHVSGLLGSLVATGMGAFYLARQQFRPVHGLGVLLPSRHCRCVGRRQRRINRLLSRC